MRTLNYVRIILLLAAVVGLTSCGDEYYDDEYLKNSDEKLCGYAWTEEYITTDGDLCIHKLEFARSGSGKETFQLKKPTTNGWGQVYKTESLNFNWIWINSMEGLKLNYGNDDVVFFDNVWVRQYYLSGNFNGVEVTFIR